jgi:AbrB family looped-hinge helix DNA binding protein
MKDSMYHIGVITTKGQITIPVEVRRLLGVGPHDKIAFHVVEGRVELEPVTMTLEDVFGAVKPRKAPEDFEELHRIALEDHVQDVLYEMQQ